MKLVYSNPGDVPGNLMSAASAGIAASSENYAEQTDPAVLLEAGLEDVLHARIRRSYDAFLRASLLLEQSDDVPLYARALSLLSYAAGSRGHNDEAMESALLSCRILRDVGSPEQKAFARNYLGVALMWNGNYDKAADEFGAAIAAAQASDSNFMTPFTNSCANEIFRQKARRDSVGQAPESNQLSTLLSSVNLGAHWQDAGMVHSGSPKHLQFMLTFYDGIRYAWANDVVTAKVRIDKCRALAAELKYQVWGAPLVGWLTAEVALCENDFSAGVLATQAMVESAIELQHEQFASLGLNLMAFVLARQGNPTDALNALKQLSAREQAIRTESLVHRQRIVDWQAKLYEQRNDAVQWQASSSHYHILSMQDPLTGLANRRGFDEALQALSSLNKTLQLHVIALDVDQFKVVNDNFSHLIGDKVLQAIGTTLQEQLRQDDIAARIGGDEFMLALQDVDDHQALAVCERIRSSIIAYPWASIAPGLSVTVSLGCSSAEPGDTTESLVMRSDRQMYADKGARRQAHVGQPD